MKIVEDYANRVAERKIKEMNEKIINKLRKKGFKKEEIAKIAEVSQEFVEKTLSQ